MRIALALLAFAAALATFCAQAGTLPTPTGQVILTVRGDIANTNAGDAAEFDLKMLDDLTNRTTVTRTPWYDGAQSFSGPFVSALMRAVGTHATTMRLHAVNDYTADVPVQDAMRYPVILATRINGMPMSVREKGPTFLIYPFDEAPDLYNEVYFGRSVWQVEAVEFF